jgi:hypothetical protein
MGELACSRPSRTKSFYLKIMSVQFSSILRTIILIVLFPGALSACNDVFPLGARSNHHIRKRRRLISPHKRQKCCWGLSGGAHFWYTFAFRVRRHEGESVFVSSGRTHSQFALKLFALMQGNRGKSPAALSLFYAGIYGESEHARRICKKLSSDWDGKQTETSDLRLVTVAKQSLLWAE